VIEWGKVPWTLWVFAALVIVPTILIEVEIHGQVPAKVLFAFVMFAWLFFLLKGVRWVWILTLGISVLGLIPDLISGSLTWQGVASGLLGIALSWPQPLAATSPASRRQRTPRLKCGIGPLSQPPEEAELCTASVGTTFAAVPHGY
jgi:hypothetical protein